MKDKLSILFYAINGTGLGHISRLNNVATDAAYLCQQLKIVPRFEFITTSDSPSLVNDFLVTKYPSKTTIKELGLPARSTAAKIKTQIIGHVSGFNADCIVLDTNPKGSYNEFPFLKELCRASVFIDRARKEETISRDVIRYIKLFDNVIVPEDMSQVPSNPFHPNTSYCGKIHGFKPEHALNRQQVRDVFGAKTNNLVYVSSGGGGDPHSETMLNKVIDSVLQADSTAKVVVGYGSLYNGSIRFDEPRITPFAMNGINKYFRGFDYAVSAAGYNTFEELKAAQCPTLFYSLNKGYDDQADRIKQARYQHLCGYASDVISPSSIREFRLSTSKIKQQLSVAEFNHGSAYAAASVIETALKKRSIGVTHEQLKNALNGLVNLRNEQLLNVQQKRA